MKTNKPSDDSLYIVMPAYNEEETVNSVARQWHKIIASSGSRSRLIIVNDGSTDQTWVKLQELSKELPQLIPLNKENSGHGATVRYAYDYALNAGADFIFQTDSDGQTLPEEFPPFWQNRNSYSAIIGHRNHRQDGASRVFVTKVLKLVIRLIFRVNVPDANTPFRLMSRKTLAIFLPKIPIDFNLTNVLLTVLLVDAKEDVLFLPITFRPRQGGTNSIHFCRIIGIGRQAIKDFRAIRHEQKRNK